MILSLLVAVADNGVIGRGNHLPWRLPQDLQWFKRLTTGHAILMGRRTYQSIGRPLPDRRTVVLSRNPDFTAAGVAVVHGLDEALALVANESEAFVVGGAGVYRQALPLAQRIYLTRVGAEIEGDVTFPEWDAADWRLVWEEPHEADEHHAYRFTFQQFDRLTRNRHD